jgi:hypothetical protein
MPRLPVPNERWVARLVPLAAVLLGVAAQPAIRSVLASVSLASGLTALRLPKGLTEDSGLAVVGDHLLAHDDERSIVYEIDPKGGRVIRTFALGRRGGEKGDFEGIAIAEDQLYLITSDGRLLVAAKWRAGLEVSAAEYQTGAGNRCEIEGIAFDSTAREMRLACKATRPTERPDVLTMLRWSIDRRVLVDPPVVVPLGGGKKGAALHPSDLARDPVTGNWVVIAARENLLVEIGTDGRVIGSTKLSKSRHRQPEGLAITREAVFIGDEGAGQTATLTRYPRR